MMSGYDMVMVGVFVVGEGNLCEACAVKRFGALRVERVRMGLDTSEDVQGLYGWQVAEDALERGEECGCERNVPHNTGEVCAACAVETCPECGKRLDRTLEAA